MESEAGRRPAQGAREMKLKLIGPQPTLFGPGPLRWDDPGGYIERLRRSMRRCIKSAEQREQERAVKSGQRAAVTVTLKQLMTKLEVNHYRCAITGLEFWIGDSLHSPFSPSLDRIKPKADYSDENIRVVLLGINSLRGEGREKDMYLIAHALLLRKQIMARFRGEHIEGGYTEVDFAKMNETFDKLIERYVTNYTDEQVARTRPRR